MAAGLTREAAALLTKPNAYIDISLPGQILPPTEIASTPRAWLEFVPEKVLFGTDAYPSAPAAGAGWEENTYASAQAIRGAPGIALGSMMADNSITRERAFEIAHLVLRDNAVKLYGLK